MPATAPPVKTTEPVGLAKQRPGEGSTDGSLWHF